MKAIFTWKRSKQPKKQRSLLYNAPLHIRHRFVHAHLSRELRKQHGIRSLGVRKGDKVKIERGQFRKHIGKVERVDLKKTRAYIEGAEITKKDGTKTLYPFHPSNLMILELNLDDKKRQKILERKKKKQEKAEVRNG